MALTEDDSEGLVVSVGLAFAFAGAMTGLLTSGAAFDVVLVGAALTLVLVRAGVKTNRVDCSSRGPGPQSSHRPPHCIVTHSGLFLQVSVQDHRCSHTSVATALALDLDDSPVIGVAELIDLLQDALDHLLVALKSS